MSVIWSAACGEPRLHERPDARSHDPASWVFPQGRFNRERWKAAWEELFRAYELVHNIRKTARIVISDEGDGAFVVVDVDTLRRTATAEALRCERRATHKNRKIPETSRRPRGRPWSRALGTSAIPV